MRVRYNPSYRITALLLSVPLLALVNCNSEPEISRQLSGKTEIVRLPSSSWAKVGSLEKKKFEETSGIAASHRVPGVYWIHNDQGNDAELHAINEKGEGLGSVKVENVENVDWEDIASFMLDGKPYLLLGDVGDNDDKRLQCFLHLIPEPTPNASGEYKKQSVTPVWDSHFRYEDGPTDCESIAVDPKEKIVYLLNKHKQNSFIYTLPLEGSQPGEILVARQHTPLKNIANATSSLTAVVKASVLGDRATAMDFRSDGRMAAVLTYTDVRLYPRSPNETWRDAFRKDPTLIALPGLEQPEALCFSVDGKSLFATSEGKSSPIYKADVPK